jgi:hypothetical protein
MGNVVERNFPMSEVPDVIIVDGVRHRRVLSAGSYFFRGKGRVKETSFLSNALPENVKGCKLKRDPKSGRMKPWIESNKHRREVMAMNDMVEEDGDYDGH